MRIQWNKKTKVIVSILSFLIALNLYIPIKEEYISSSALSFKWHLFNEAIVQKWNFKIKLPYKWWVVKESNDKIVVSRVPKFDDHSLFGTVFIQNKKITRTDLNFFKNERILEDGTKLIKINEIEALKVGNEVAYSIEYIVFSNEGRKKIYWTITIPSKELVLGAIEIYQVNKKIIEEELLNRIIFL